MRKAIVSIMFALLTLTSFSQGKIQWSNVAELNYGRGLNECIYNMFGISYVRQMRINGYFSAGVGVGYEYVDGLYSWGADNGKYSETEDSRHDLRAFLRAKVHLGKTDNVLLPFLSFDIGYTYDPKIDYMASGLFLCPSFGIDFSIGGERSMYAAIGVNLQSYECIYSSKYTPSSVLSEYIKGWDKEEIVDDNSQCIDFRLGFVF